MPINGSAARATAGSAVVLLAAAVVVGGSGFWLGGKARAQRGHEAAARVTRARADVARRIARHPTAKFVVRQAAASRRFGPAQEAGLRKAFAAAAARHPAGLRKTALGGDYARFLNGLVAASVTDQPQKWQADLSAYAAKLEKQSAASRPLPDWLAPYAPLLPGVAWGLGAMLGLLGVTRLIATRPSLSMPTLPRLPKRRGATAVAPATEAAAVGPDAPTAAKAAPEPVPAVPAAAPAATASAVPAPDPTAVAAAAAAAAAESIRAEYENQLEGLRAERNEARRLMLIIQARLEEAEVKAAAASVAAAEAAAGTPATSAAASPSPEAESLREEKETLERHVQALQAHAAELEEAFRQADFRAETAEMRASQLTGEVTELEETLFARAAELRDIRRTADELRAATVTTAVLPVEPPPPLRAAESLTVEAPPLSPSSALEAPSPTGFDLKDILGAVEEYEVRLSNGAYDLSAANFDVAAEETADRDAPEDAGNGSFASVPAAKRTRVPRTRSAARLAAEAEEPRIAEVAAKGGVRARRSAEGPDTPEVEAGGAQASAGAEAAHASLPQSAAMPPPSLAPFPPAGGTYPFGGGGSTSGS